jgi:hypothetical protein
MAPIAAEVCAGFARSAGAAAAIAEAPQIAVPIPAERRRSGGTRITRPATSAAANATTAPSTLPPRIAGPSSMSARRSSRAPSATIPSFSTGPAAILAPSA